MVFDDRYHCTTILKECKSSVTMTVSILNISLEMDIPPMYYVRDNSLKNEQTINSYISLQ